MAHSLCPQNIWNHKAGCTCAAITRVDDASETASPFGVYDHVGQSDSSVDDMRDALNNTDGRNRGDIVAANPAIPVELQWKIVNDHPEHYTALANNPGIDPSVAAALAREFDTAPVKTEVFTGYGFDAEINDTEWLLIPSSLAEELMDDQDHYTPTAVDGNRALLTKVPDADGYRVAMRLTDYRRFEAKFVKVPVVDEFAYPEDPPASAGSLD